MLRIACVWIAVLALAGCGGGDKKPPPSPTAGQDATVKPDRRPVDIRIVIKGDGPAETAFVSPADPDRQRVTLINRTRYAAVVTGRSSSGGGSRAVASGSRGSVAWKRSSGPGKLRGAVRFPGHSALNTASTTPIG